MEVESSLMPSAASVVTAKIDSNSFSCGLFSPAAFSFVTLTRCAAAFSSAYIYKNKNQRSFLFLCLRKSAAPLPRGQSDRKREAENMICDRRQIECDMNEIKVSQQFNCGLYKTSPLSPASRSFVHRIMGAQQRALFKD